MIGLGKLKKTSGRKKAGGAVPDRTNGLSRERERKRVIQNKTKRKAVSEDAGVQKYFALTTAPQVRCVED